MNRWKVKVSLFLNFLVLAILLNSVGTVALQVQRTYGVSASAAGWLAAFKSLGIVTASFLAISRLGQFGYRRTMLCALGGLTVVCLSLPSASGFAVLELLFVAVGAGYALLKVSIYATVGLVTNTPTEHASFMSFLESFFTGGIVLGYFLFGAFVDDLHPRSTDWLRAFYVIAAFSFVAWLLLLASPLDETAVKAGRRLPWREQWMGIFRLTVTRVVMLFATCTFLYVMVEQSIMNWLPTYNRTVLRLPASVSIQMASLFIVAMAAGRFLAGILLRRAAWFPVLVLCGAAAAAGLAVLDLLAPGVASAPAATGWQHAPAMAYLLPCVGFFVAPIYPALNSVMLSALPVSRHGAMAGMSVLFSALGSSIGTVALGFLFQDYGGQLAFYFPLLPIAALLISLAFFRKQAATAPGASLDPS